MRFRQLIAIGLWISFATPALAQTLVAIDAEVPRARWGTSFGLGFDAQWRREINPGFGEFAGAPHLFATVRFARVTALIEAGRAADRRTRSGGLNVRTGSTTTAAWGRYAFDERGPWTSFASLGGGARFERVRTTFERSEDERRGTRRFVGIGVGSSYVCFSKVLLEAEARVTSEEATKFPGLSVMMRAGVVL